MKGRRRGKLVLATASAVADRAKRRSATETRAAAKYPSDFEVIERENYRSSVPREM